MTPRFKPLLSFLSAALLLVGCLGDGKTRTAVELQPVVPSVTLSLQRIGGTAADGLGAAEINAFDAGTLRAFVVNGAGSNVDVLDLRNPAAPARVATLDIRRFCFSEPHSRLAPPGNQAVRPNP